MKQQKDRVRFKATAKLSKEGDDHLPHESVNYESFPGHWYERWTGLNLLKPLHDPVPCGPVVPQYYGYYVPVGGKATGRAYQSSIMLLEDCGKQVVIDEMNDAEKEECASLFLRMHEDHWTHNSPYERNVMVDEEEVLVVSKVGGGASMTFHTKKAFRLIDFGRSELTNVERDSNEACATEGSRVLSTFGAGGW
ncbi:hypothetical protein BKA70DRAFT_1103232 [Coprinopsis sp. MPI-PUGE-AT-0042]|nr:hypothetical protein BKA70DRAFT_1103232 [Coprinopsis sp. MPI-PUGE-AT-0042]